MGNSRPLNLTRKPANSGGFFPEIPLADSGSLPTGPSADNEAGFEIGRLPKPNWKIRTSISVIHPSEANLSWLVSKASLARIIVYSMAPDSIPSPPSNAPTPAFTPLPSGMNTPQLRNSSAKDYLSVPLIKAGHSKYHTYLAGSKALDSLVRLIASTESFFHPSNSGNWTADVCTSFINLKRPFLFLAASYIVEVFKRELYAD